MNFKKQIIEIEDCNVHSEIVNKSVKILKSALPSYVDFPLKYFLQNNESICLVLKTNKLVDTTFIKNIIANLQDIGIKSLQIHYFESCGKKIMGKGKNQLIFGEQKIQNSDGFFYTSKTFSQLIKKLYYNSLNSTSTFFEISENDLIIDLYCGIGISISIWENSGAQVFGIESNIEAVECAKLNTKNAEILIGSCTQRIPQLIKWLTDKNQNKKFYLYVNPPRTGLDAEILNWILIFKPQKIAYLSCSAGTLCKDLNILTEKDYTVIKITPFDFFPFSIHVETLVFLELN